MTAGLEEKNDQAYYAAIVHSSTAKEGKRRKFDYQRFSSVATKM